MATSAFKSTTKRAPLGRSPSTVTTDDCYSSSNRSTSSSHRRARSLSRFSRPFRDDFSDEPQVPSGRFVNTMRGSSFPDITLDDIAVELFNSGDRGRSALRNNGDVSSGDNNNNKVSVSQRRGRSVSRRVGEGKGSCANSNVGGGRVNSENNNSRRRRSVSVVRYQISDSESDLDHSQYSSNRAASKSFSGGSTQVPLSSKAAASNHRQALRRSLSQKDLKYHDGYSSHSSVLTDDEGRDAHSNVNGTERTIRTVYTQKKGTRKPSDDCLQSRNSDVLQAVSTIRRNYATKLELSEKRKKDLLAEILLEEQHGRELSKMVKELLPEPKDNVAEKPTRARKKSSDRSRMSMRLTEEAEKYFEDFISNVEDTDISSLDGEMTDTSSSLGGITKTQVFQSPALSKSVPVEMDGVVLPWLQWETSNDASPLLSRKAELVATPKTHLWETAQEATPGKDLSYHSISSNGSWSPGVIDGHSTSKGETVTGNRFGEYGSHCSQFSSGGTKPRFDVDEYLKRQSEEDFLFERWNQQRRIHSGSLLLCNQIFF
ncbi:uncharacterized protein LOC8266349 isoform X2 [Ricinus communis]|uniref:Uncharacterized protein n=1 Tax=Ricinus communis TaxID=3988 RepID=B9RAK9_RICCO|nr:uncharacterized protein LOC8266349 isoform X2 [Ricinus communis]EEF51836.1 conserved hypothetical protein [Ricinus communis]|eukprot:XP_002511234.1 uncharacterized protein LOC8266349 isoform X2 [Ricinus communis]